jgi:DNA-directed RNA polymerase specialized sigma24 family protein
MKWYDLGRADARSWLYGIAANVIGRHRRAEIRRLRTLARTAPENYRGKLELRGNQQAAL